MSLPSRLFIFLFFLCVIEGSVDVTPLCVQTGGDVLLEGHKPQDFNQKRPFLWKFNDNNIIQIFPGIEPEPSKIYKGRVDFYVETFSLRLKDLKKSDSGLYLAFIQEDKDRITAKYNLTVVDPVSPVVLQVDSVSNTSVPCDVTVTCSTNTSDIIIIIITNFTCEKQTCSLQGGQRSKVTPSGSSISIHTDGGFFICSHSNQVSKTNATKKIEQVCLQRPDPTPSSASSSILTAVLGVFFFLVLLVSFVFWYRGLCPISLRRKNVHQTYSTAGAESPGPSADVPESTYSMVGPHTGPTRSSEGEGNTLYAEVHKGPRPRDNEDKLPSN